MLYEGADRVLARQEAVDALYEGMRRSGPKERPPVLLFTGTGGSGKTALVSRLAAEIDQMVPYARVDFARSGRDSGLPQVLSALAYELGRKCPGYGRLRFHRLVVGTLAMNQEVDFTDPDTARRRMSAVLRSHRGYDRVWEFTRASAGGLIDSAVPPPANAVIGPAAEGGINRIAGGYFGNRFLLGEPYRWYGHRDRGSGKDPLDVLSDLNRHARNPDDADNRRFVDELLMEAFTADLRAAFSRGIRAHPGMYDCVLLLDNTDSELGRRFLDCYLGVRRRSAALSLPPDPFVVAATSRLPAERHAHEKHMHELPLRGLTGDETEALARPELSGRTDHRMPLLIHTLTGGHPGTTALLLDTVAVWPSAAAGGMRSLLMQEAPPDAAGSPAGVSVEQRLRRDLLRGLPGIPETAPLDDDLLRTLTVFCAARSVDDASWLISEYLTDALLSGEALWSSGLWGDGAATGDRALLRWLLLRWSSRRSDDPVPELRHRLSERSRASGDTAGELYHALGAGGFDRVARSLAEHVSGPPAPDGGGPGTPAWIELLRYATSVPRIGSDDAAVADRPPHRLQKDLADQVRADGEGPAPRHLAAVARIAAGLWIAADPLTSPDRYYLHTQIATDLRGLATHSEQPVDLFQAAREHDRLAQDWT